jgi:hypothetical protein
MADNTKFAICTTAKHGSLEPWHSKRSWLFPIALIKTLTTRIIGMVTNGYLLWLNIGYLVGNQLATLTQYKGMIKHK